MKSDQRVDDGGRQSDAFGFFFEICEFPAAVCNSKLELIAANQPFVALCGLRSPPGGRLERALGCDSLPVPMSGGSIEHTARNAKGEQFRVLLARRGNRVAVRVKRAHREQRDREVQRTPLKYLEDLLEHANALIVATDPKGKIRAFSKLFLNLTGWSKEEVLGRDLLSLVPEVERMRVAQVLASALRGERGCNFETRIAGRQARDARVSLASSPVFGPEGQVDGMIAIGQDLTTLKELEHRIIHAEKLASLGRFAASVAHEINNPLTAVVSYADALLARSIRGDGADQEKLRKILDGCERILRFTRRLVSYARPAPDRLERVELNQLLDTSLTYCDHVLSHYGIAVEREYQDVPEVCAIKGNLAQVFVNLITNACQAMQPGGTLRLCTDRDGPDAIIRVSDNGPGMDCKTLEKIFEPFFTTKADGAGSGLGLSIAQSIVESHGGKIQVHSSVGDGTTFVIRLPGSPPAGAIVGSLTFDNHRAQSATF